MIKLFKRTRNYLHSLLLKNLLWFMRNVWTNPTFMCFFNAIQNELDRQKEKFKRIFIPYDNFRESNFIEGF